MNLIWGTGGTSIFDVYSIHHIVWFIALTTVLTAIFQRYAWLGAAAIVIGWEVFEQWVCIHIPNFPFAGQELWYNKIVGDTISDLLGFLIAMWALKTIRKWKNAEQTTGMEEE